MNQSPATTKETNMNDSQGRAILEEIVNLDPKYWHVINEAEYETQLKAICEKHDVAVEDFRTWFSS